jgi:choline dehydrogenase
MRAGLDYALNRRGILTIGAGVVGVFARSRPDLEHPDVQIHFMPLSGIRPGAGLHTFSGVTASVCQLRPESRGTLEIASADADQPPRIVANYLATETDRRTTIDGLKLMRRIAAQPSFRAIVKREAIPGPEVDGDDALLADARARGTTIFHPCGTCKMGQDPHAVVDERLAVRGIEGLRVVDASIMPTMTSGNTNAPTIMIAEKAADMILAKANGAVRQAA